MTSTKLDIRVNATGNEKPQLYSNVQIGFEFHKEKLAKINESLCEICSSRQAPFVLISLPMLDFKGIFIEGKDSICEFKEIVKNNKLYQAGNLKSKQQQKLVHNAEKAFQKLSSLDNWAKFSIALYDPQNIKKKQDLWNRSHIKGQANIDFQFIEMFHEIIKEISPDFANSPIIIFFELLESVDINLNLKSFSLPQPQFRDLISKILSIDLASHSKFLAKLRQTSEQLTIRITLGHLFSIKIRGPSKAISALLTFM